MNIDLQFKLKSDPTYIRYLRENSYWYKILNRNPEAWSDFQDEMKTAYKMRPVDKINNVVDSIEMIKNFIGVLK